MKKLKIKKHMVSFLMLAIMVVSIIGSFPVNAFADNADLPEYTFRMYSTNNSNKFELFQMGQNSDGDMVTFWNKGSSQFLIAKIVNSQTNFDGAHYVYNADKDASESELKRTDNPYSYSNNTFKYNGKMYYFCYYCISYNNLPYGFSGNLGIVFTTTADIARDPVTIIRDFIADTLPSTFSKVSDNGNDTAYIPDGSQDNPMEDKDIGTIVLKSHGFIPTKNNNFFGDVSASYDYYFKYKDETSSGFSISDNKYARTFIQVRVQNQCVLFEPGDEDTIKEYYPHYGEFYQYKNLATENISNNTVKVSWGDVMLKWSDYTEHPFALNKKLAYRFMIRVICTDSLTVVPDENSGWYAGGWRSFIFDGDKFLEETNGHIDSDGNWSDDEDDGHNDSSDKTSHTDKDKDDIDKILNDDSSSLTISNIKSFLDEVGNVPKAIGKLFSFLPDWVTTFIGFGFVVLVSLIVIKVIK